MTRYILNPLRHDVEKMCSLEEDGKMYILPAESLFTCENESVFNHLLNYIIGIILDERGTIHWDHEKEKVRQEIVKEYE